MLTSISSLFHDTHRKKATSTLIKFCFQSLQKNCVHTLAIAHHVAIHVHQTYACQNKQEAGGVLYSCRTLEYYTRLMCM